VRDKYDCQNDAEPFEDQECVLPSDSVSFMCPKLETDWVLPMELTPALSGCLKGDMRLRGLSEVMTAYLVGHLSKKRALNIIQ